MTTLETFAPTADVESIAAFEVKTGLILPEDYKRFLRERNGGRPQPSAFDVPNWPGEWSDVGDFFALYSGKECNLEAWHEMLRHRLPHGFLAIADDPGGNFICLGTTPPYNGKVYYWDSSNDWDIPEGADTLFEVASGFETFLDNLKEPPPPR